MIWKSKFNQLIVQFVDFCTVLLGFYLSYLTWIVLYKSISYPIPPYIQFTNTQFLLVLITALIFVFFLKVLGAYKFQRFTSIVSEYFTIFKVSVISFLIFIFFIFIFKLGSTPRTIIILSFIEINILFLIQKSSMFYIAKQYRKTNHDRKKAIIFGTGERTKKLLNTINRNFEWGLDIIAIITTNKKFDVLG